MDYKVREDAGITILDLSGEIDVSYAPRLRDILIELIESKSKRVLVNLSEVAYLDSAGLSVFIAAHRKARNIGGVLGLSSPQKSVQRVFDLTRTNKVFQIFSTVEEGVAALSNS